MTAKRKHTKPHHHHGTDETLSRVGAACKAQGERLTDVRRDVITVLAKLKEPAGAYKILAIVNKGRAKKLSPISVYRTLDFLIQLGAAIKIESQNAYQLCEHDHHGHSHLMMVCDGCGSTSEVHDDETSNILSRLAARHGHHLKHHAIELHGLCTRCR